MQSNQANGGKDFGVEGDKSGASTATDGDILCAASITVTIVDDEQLVADLLASIIRSFGMTVLGVFTDLQSFVHGIEESPPSLSVLDASMPEVWQVTRRVMTLQPTAALIILDDAFRNHQLNRALECGAAGYLNKQDSLESFEAALKRISIGARLRSIPSQSHRAKQCTRNPGLLTDREIEVLRLLASGLTAHRCAGTLGISANTVEHHSAEIIRKVDVRRTPLG